MRQLAGQVGTRRFDPCWLHCSLLIVLAGAWESLFLHHGLNALDEGWPLYAAMQLQAGGRLYQDVFFVFPPGHLLPAWIAHGLDPPGLVLARLIYASFNVALCVAIYLLGRRVMEPRFALLGAAMLAIATPDSHGSQLLFGYRYLLFSALAMGCFEERLRTGKARWLVGAGICTGLALLFRLTPAAAAAFGIGIGTLAASRSWRGLWGDTASFSVAFLGVVVPVLAFFALQSDIETVWREVVVRPVAMTALQSRPVPPLMVPAVLDRFALRESFVTVQFRLFALLYLGYALVLGLRLARATLARRPFRDPLLLAIVIWGGIYFLRSLGRSDEPHLDSTLPPVCLLLAHAASRSLSRWGPRGSGTRPRLALPAVVFALWVFLVSSDLYLDEAVRGTIPVQALDGATAIRPESFWSEFDALVALIRAETTADEVVLDLSWSPLLHVVAERRGPGWADLLMPGTFLDEAEERAFLERLVRAPPALVVVSRMPFDRDPKRAVWSTAPQLTRWVRKNYRPWRSIGRFLIFKPESELR